MLSTIALALVLALLPLAESVPQTYSATYLPSNAPDKSEQGQAGTNRCPSTNLNQTSECQNAYINSVTDFCIFAPPAPGPDAVIGNTERIEVAWCTKPGTGTRLIPDGAITGAHFVKSPDWVQVTGTYISPPLPRRTPNPPPRPGSGNLTFLNVPAGDMGVRIPPISIRQNPDAD
ncbi:hypothetical protein H0H87_005927, partial [Tephrocybe sp. NHM501043]